MTNINGKKIDTGFGGISGGEATCIRCGTRVKVPGVAGHNIMITSCENCPGKTLKAGT